MTAVTPAFTDPMTIRRFSVTWDYRCPFAYKVHDHIVEAIEGGADWDVTFVPFSLGQVHVADGGVDIWERPGDDSGLLALRAGVVVRDRHPDSFLKVHRALFMARHVHARHLRDEEVIGDVLSTAGVDAGSVFDDIATGWPLETIRKEHEAAVAEHDVWGVPTFMVGDRAAFVRLMEGSDGDGATSRQTIERLVDMVGGWPELNELKHTNVDH